MRLDPVDFTLPQGQLSGSVKVDARSATAQTAMDLRLRKLVLQALLAAKQQRALPDPATASTAPPAITGTLDSRVQLSGHGNSVHDVMATANGELSAVLPGGDIRKAFSQLAGINVARGLGLLLSGSQQDDHIRCGIMAFKVDDGVGRVQQILFDTNTVLITGSGDIDFGRERLDLSLQGHAKKFSLFHVYAPVRVAGTFSKPSVGIGAEKLALQGGMRCGTGRRRHPARQPDRLRRSGPRQGSELRRGARDTASPKHRASQDRRAAIRKCPRRAPCRLRRTPRRPHTEPQGRGATERAWDCA